MPTTDHNQLLKRIERLNSIGAALSAQQSLEDLLEMILLGAKELTQADGGSLYLVEGQQLHFVLIHTTSLQLHMGGTSGRPIRFPPIQLLTEQGAPNLTMVATRAIHEDRLINIADAYADTDYDFSGTRAFDTRTGYRSSSFLTVPMKDHEEKIIGVLQLINATDPQQGTILPFSPADESLAASLASQAAIALTRKRLTDGLEELLQALVKLIANAIDDKSPHTGGHCRRVPLITMALAEAVHNDTGPAHRATRFTAQHMKELEMAAWLHDCGKITTPEYVVDKQTKLETIFDRIHLVKARCNILRREAELAQLRSTCPDPVAAGKHAPSLQDSLAEIDALEQFLSDSNVGGEFLGDDKIARIEQAAGYCGALGEQSLVRPLLTEEEVANLSIRKGTLSPEERGKINHHAEVSVMMLSALPFPDPLKNVPEIAGGHHERMDGRGYPRGIPAGELSVQARILAVADVFEALTASDRVYRKPNRLSEALKIMAFMCREGHIDPELFDVFLRHQAYAKYAQTQMKPEQIDAIDSAALRAIYQTVGQPQT